MRFTDKIDSIWDEVSWASDTDFRSSLYKVQSYAVSRGSFQGSDFRDYYQLDLSAGNYTLFVSTEGLNDSAFTSQSFDVDIVDSFGSVVLSEDLLGPDPYTDQISFSYTGDGDFYLQITANTSTDFNYEAAVYFADSVVIPAPPQADDWRLYASDGFMGLVGGSGKVIGTQAAQDIAVFSLAEIVSFDPSFNRGGDLIRLDGDASDWSVTRSGSSALLYDGATFVELPFGSAGTYIDFDDGARVLVYDTVMRQLLIGDQVVEDAYDPIEAAPDSVTLPGIDLDATARLYLSEGTSTIFFGNGRVIGTDGAETVTVGVGDISFDPSFNKGGDTIDFIGLASDFTAMQSGSSVIIEGMSVVAEIPFGATGATLSFDDGERTLVYDFDARALLIGDQVIGTVPTELGVFA